MAKPAVTMKGNPVELAGGEVNVGDPAPEFQAVGTDLQPVGLLARAVYVIVAGGVLPHTPAVPDITTVSDHRDVSFGRAYGVLLEDLRLLARAVFVIDAEGVVRHTQVVPEITAEPDYDAVLEAVKSLV